MRGSFIILVLLPILSCSQAKQFIREYQAHIKEIKERGRVNLAGVDTTEFPMGCLEETATIDLHEWETYLQNNLALDDASLDTIPAGIYNVFVRFVIDKEGKISDVSIYKDPGHGLGRRVVKAISRYEGLWESAKLNGHATVSYRMQPITFIVEEEKQGCEDELPAELIL